METPDTTRAQAQNGIATIVVIAGVLASPEVGLGDTPVWVRLVIAGAIFAAYSISHLFADAKIRAGRAGIQATANEVAAAQLKQLAARPEGDDSLVQSSPALQARGGGSDPAGLSPPLGS